MPEQWHGINDPGYFIKPQTAPADQTRTPALTDNIVPQKKKEEQIIASLGSAQFVPDDKTDFTKPCKVKVDINGEKTSRVTFALWARYKGKEYDLQHQVAADSVKNQATANLNLHYLTEHYNDFTGNDKGATVEYFAKVSMKGAKPITSEVLKMPQKSTAISDSVGQNGKNKTEDVKLVQQKLIDLSYPVSSASGTCDAETIKAIKFFQAFNKHFPKGPISVDGKIDKGGQTENTLFGKSPKKYVEIKKGSDKKLEPSIEKKKNDAISGKDADQKKKWENVMSMWDKVNPYLPDLTRMESGYRTTESQRQQLYIKYNSFKKQISKKFGDETWEKYSALQDTDMSAQELKESDIVMHRHICEAVNSNEVALPGKSKHEYGQAIGAFLSQCPILV